MDGVKWELNWYPKVVMAGPVSTKSVFRFYLTDAEPDCLPSAADLDAVAEEQRIKEITSGQDKNL